MDVENRWLPWVIAVAAVVLLLGVIAYVVYVGDVAHRSPNGARAAAGQPGAGGFRGGSGAGQGAEPAPARLGQMTKSTGCHVGEGLPDPACTPGATDSRVTQANIGQTICVSGWTSTVRPPASVTDPIKQERMAAYGLAGQPPSRYELDHLVPLELGGHPRDVANLWPEDGQGPLNFREKDNVENAAHEAVCQGRLPLAEAQRRMAQDWQGLYADLLGHRP